MADDLASLGRKVTAIQDAIGRETMRQVGKDLEPLIGQAVAADIGDHSMSGFRRGAPIAITGTSRVLNQHAVLVEPVKEAKGPMAVLERGRNAGGGVGLMQGPGVLQTGRTRRNKNGMVGKVRRKTKERRWNGYTDPKYTMSDAAELMSRKTGGLFLKEVRGELGKQLRRG